MKIHVRVLQKEVTYMYYNGVVPMVVRGMKKHVSVPKSAVTYMSTNGQKKMVVHNKMVSIHRKL